MASFTRGITFATNGTVTAENLHNLIDQTTPRAGIITDRSVLTTMSTGDQVLIADTDDATNAYFITTGSLVGQALSGATYGGASFTAGTIATFNSTTGTVTNLTSSTATISTLAGNTTGGTFSGNVVATAGTVTTLTASTLTGALSGGTYSGNVIATAGTITNLSTTLAGDLTISQGTATLGTTGVTAGTYGTSTIVPTIAVDDKGRVTSVGTSAVSSGKILQVVSASVTGGSGGFSTTSTSYVDITGLSASITPSATSSNILCNVSIAANFDVIVGYKITRQIGSGSETDVSVGTTYGSSRRSATFAPSYYYSNTCSFSLIDSPNTSGTAVTYRVKVAKGDSIGGYVFRLNLSFSSTDTDIATNFISSSHIILTEIAG